MNIFGHITKELHRTIEGAFCSAYWYAFCKVLQRCFTRNALKVEGSSVHW